MRECERSIVLVKGAVSHAFTKPAFMSGLGAAQELRRIEAGKDEIGFARDVASCTPGDPRYARADLPPTPAGLRLMELELIEPQLALHFDGMAADRLAGALLAG